MYVDPTVPGIPPTAEKEPGVRQAMLTRDLFEKYGYTAGCALCRRIRANRAGASQGGTHTVVCRQRMEGEMRQDAKGRARLERAAERFARHVADGGEPAPGPQQVRLRSLIQRPDVNGTTGTLLREDESRGKWQVKAPDGKIYWVKPEHFAREGVGGVEEPREQGPKKARVEESHVSRWPPATEAEPE